MSEAEKPRAWVTGASSGIGAAVATRLLESGWRVLGTSRSLDRLSAQPSLEGERFDGESLDLEDLETLPNRLDEMLREYGPPEVAVLAAGVGLLGALEESSFQQIRRVIDVNLTAQIFIARALLPPMKRQGRGDLVLIGSEASLQGRRRGSVYCAAKFGLRGLAQALREECATSGVRVSIVHPGTVRTPFFDDLEIEPGPEPKHALEPSDVATAVEHVLSLPPEAVVDEIMLSPRVQQVRRRRSHNR